MKPQPRKALDPLMPYVPGEFEEGSIKLASNENPFGASPSAIKAYKQAAASIHLYPDGGGNALRQALASHYGLDVNKLALGAGSDELIRNLFHAYLTPDDEVIFPEYGFLMYRLATQANGAKAVPVKEKDYRIDVEAILGAITDQTKIIILANPNNPTGTYIPQSDIDLLVEKVPEHILLILDAAYAEFAEFELGDEMYQPGHYYVEGRENVVVLRTYSKVYGLSALRVGWAHGPQAVIDTINKVRGAFNVTTPSQMTAMAALGDQAFIQETLRRNKAIREEVVKALEERGIKTVPSVCNFFLMDCENPGRAKDIYRRLKENKVIVRPVGFYSLDRFLRVSIGTEDEMKQFIKTLDKVLSS